MLCYSDNLTYFLDDDEDALPVWYGDIWKFRGTRKSEITRPIDSSSADNLDISDDEDWTSQVGYYHRSTCILFILVLSFIKVIVKESVKRDY